MRKILQSNSSFNAESLNEIQYILNTKGLLEKPVIFLESGYIRLSPFKFMSNGIMAEMDEMTLAIPTYSTYYIVGSIDSSLPYIAPVVTIKESITDIDTVIAYFNGKDFEYPDLISKEELEDAITSLDGLNPGISDGEITYDSALNNISFSDIKGKSAGGKEFTVPDSTISARKYFTLIASNNSLSRSGILHLFNNKIKQEYSGSKLETADKTLFIFSSPANKSKFVEGFGDNKIIWTQINSSNQLVLYSYDLQADTPTIIGVGSSVTNYDVAKKDDQLIFIYISGGMVYLAIYDTNLNLIALKNLTSILSLPLPATLVNIKQRKDYLFEIYVYFNTTNYPLYCILMDTTSPSNIIYQVKYTNTNLSNVTKLESECFLTKNKSKILLLTSDNILYRYVYNHLGYNFTSLSSFNNISDAYILKDSIDREIIALLRNTSSKHQIVIYKAQKIIKYYDIPLTVSSFFASVLITDLYFGYTDGTNYYIIRFDGKRIETNSYPGASLSRLDVVHGLLGVTLISGGNTYARLFPTGLRFPEDDKLNIFGLIYQNSTKNFYNNGINTTPRVLKKKFVKSDTNLTAGSNVYNLNILNLNKIVEKILDNVSPTDTTTITLKITSPIVIVSGLYENISLVSKLNIQGTLYLHDLTGAEVSLFGGTGITVTRISSNTFKSTTKLKYKLKLYDLLTDGTNKIKVIEILDDYTFKTDIDTTVTNLTILPDVILDNLIVKRILDNGVIINPPCNNLIIKNCKLFGKIKIGNSTDIYGNCYIEKSEIEDLKVSVNTITIKDSKFKLDSDTPAGYVFETFSKMVLDNNDIKLVNNTTYPFYNHGNLAVIENNNFYEVLSARLFYGSNVINYVFRNNKGISIGDVSVLNSINLDQCTLESPGIASINLFPNSITTVEIANSAVTLEKLAPNSVDSSKIVDGSIQNNDIADFTILSRKINRNSGFVTVGDSAYGDQYTGINGLINAFNDGYSLILLRGGITYDGPSETPGFNERCIIIGFPFAGSYPVIQGTLYLNDYCHLENIVTGGNVKIKNGKNLCYLKNVYIYADNTSFALDIEGSYNVIDHCYITNRSGPAVLIPPGGGNYNRILNSYIATWNPLAGGYNNNHTIHISRAYNIIKNCFIARDAVGIKDIALIYIYGSAGNYNIIEGNTIYPYNFATAGAGINNYIRIGDGSNTPYYNKVINNNCLVTVNPSNLNYGVYVNPQYYTFIMGNRFELANAVSNLTNPYNSLVGFNIL